MAPVPYSSSSTSLKWSYDVFLSFRGEDTRQGFTSHLYHALWRVGFFTFMDDRLRDVGEEFSLEILLRKIEQSRFLIAVFSENYASSRWCLEELVRIMDWKEKTGQHFLPVFYKVEPSEIKNQSGRTGEHLQNFIEKFGEDSEKVRRWRTALEESANLVGPPFRLALGMTEQQLIKDIVKVVSGKLKRPSLRAAHHPVGLHYLMERINPLVGIGEDDDDDDDVRMIGIHGDKEVGKSTLAKALFNHHSHRFEGCSFLEHVKATAGLHGLVKVQETLLRETLGDAYDGGMRLGNSSIGASVIARSLRFKKVLVVIDDVNALEQLRELAGGKDWFGLGSRIIITTQDRDLLQRCGDVEAEHMYEMERLSRPQSRQLLCWNAFKSPIPPKTFTMHVERMLEVIGEGHSGRLIRIASNLRGKSPEEWDSTIEKLSQAEDGSEGRDKLILNHTVDGLEQLHKAIFLVIAYLSGRDKGEVVDIFGHVAESRFNRAIKKLTNQSLISTHRNRIWVNDSLREPSKEMIRAESRTQFQWIRKLDDLVEGSPDEVLQSIKEEARTMCDGFFGDSDDRDSDGKEENEDNNEH